MSNEKIKIFLGKFGIEAEGNCAYIIAGSVAVVSITVAVVIAKKPELITDGIKAYS